MDVSSSPIVLRTVDHTSQIVSHSKQLCGGARIACLGKRNLFQFFLDIRDALELHNQWYGSRILFDLKTKALVKQIFCHWGTSGDKASSQNRGVARVRIVGRASAKDNS